MRVELNLSDLSAQGRAKVANALNQSVLGGFNGSYVEVSLSVFSPSYSGQFNLGAQYSLQPGIILGNSLNAASQGLGTYVMGREGGNAVNHEQSGAGGNSLPTSKKDRDRG